MAGGGTGGGSTETFMNSVLALLPSSSGWTPLASLPHPVYRPKASIVSNRLWLACGEFLTKPRDRPFVDQVTLLFELAEMVHRCWSTCPDAGPKNQIYGGWLIEWNWPDTVPPK